ncbi:hypothetical protein ACB098_01G057500 [Castanea mollissima]
MMNQLLKLIQSYRPTHMPAVQTIQVTILEPISKARSLCHPQKWPSLLYSMTISDHTCKEASDLEQFALRGNAIMTKQATKNHPVSSTTPSGSLTGYQSCPIATIYATNSCRNKEPDHFKPCT